MIPATRGETADENKRCPNQTPKNDFGHDRNADLSRLRDDLLREHSFVTESTQADADSKED
jgi:hypothetical protein